MSQNDFLDSSTNISLDNGVSRRHLLAGAAMGTAGLMGLEVAHAQGAPKKGGVLRMGLAGGSTADTLDPRAIADAIPLTLCNMLMNGLVEIDAKGNLVGELLESWETKPGAAEWVFKVRKGVTFTSGKTMDADDVIYSINLHRGETKSPAKALLAPITDISKLSSHEIQVKLSSGNADLPYVFNDYHILVVPNGFTDWTKPDGTGAFTMTSFEPGVRAVFKRKSGNFWKPGRGNFDGVEIRYIGDTAARTQALMSGQVDVINRVDAKTAPMVIKSNAVGVLRNRGTGNRFAFVAMRDAAPYNNNDVMMGLKLGIDRKKIVDNVFSGFASIGNDQLLATTNKYFNAKLPQHTYDPDKAAFHFKKAGFTGTFELQVSEGAYPGATDSAVLFQESLKKCNVKLDVKRVSADGYWDNVWLKQPFCAVYWASRPTADLQYSTTFMSDAPWNDTHWKRPEFDKLVIAARTELDETKRRQMYHQAQNLVVNDGGMIVFAVGDVLEAYNKKLRGMVAHPRFELNDTRLPEKGWFA